MKSDWKGVDVHTTKHWKRHINNYPSAAPRVGTYTDGWTDDLLISQSNNVKRLRSKKAKHVGGDFYVVKRSYEESSTLGEGIIAFQHDLFPQTREETIQRARHASVTNSAFPLVSASSESALRELGRQAIARVTPTASHSDLATAIGELISEGLPSMIGLAGRGRDAPARAGSEYLNYEFGVRPLMNDVTKAVDAYRNAEKIWDQYVKSSGQVLRRRYDFPTESSTTHEVFNYPAQPLMDSSMRSPNSRMERTVSSFSRRWFVGGFIYYVPANPFDRNASKWELLYGVVPDINTIWNLTPWSWAADWVADIGTFTENFANFQKDGLVLKYGYMMEHKSVTDRYVLGPISYRGKPGDHYLTQSFKTETKRRVAAWPYGFSLNWDGFSPKQVAILSSLGMTRGRRS